MAQNTNMSESGDSNELQMLFDSIASSSSAASPPQQHSPVTTSAPSSAAEVGDNDELQALFDSTAMKFAASDAELVAAEASAIATKEAAAPESGAVSGAGTGAKDVFKRIGQMTRQLHDTLRQLGLEDGLHEVAEAIPDARQRLSYIAQMTEQAASRVLNATDIALPIQEKVGADAEALRERWNKVFAGQCSAEQFQALSKDTHLFLGETVKQSKATNEQLMDIMMAQDFQDLTGQVIKKVIEMAQRLENDLLQVLLEVTPEEKKTDKHSGLINGPVISSEGREDVVTSQEQVDNLLESLGF